MLMVIWQYECVSRRLVAHFKMPQVGNPIYAPPPKKERKKQRTGKIILWMPLSGYKESNPVSIWMLHLCIKLWIKTRHKLWPLGKGRPFSCYFSSLHMGDWCPGSIGAVWITYTLNIFKHIKDVFISMKTLHHVNRGLGASRTLVAPEISSYGFWGLVMYLIHNLGS